MSDHKRDLMPAAWVSAFAVAWAVFQIWVAFFGPVDNLILRPVHVFWAAALTFLLRPGFRKTPNPRIGWDDVALALLSVAVGVYILSQHTRLIERTAYVDSVELADYIVGIVAVLLVLEGSRRLVGISLSLVAVGFIIYAFAGQYMPGIFAHRGITLDHFIELEILSNPPDGLFGMITGVSAEMVFYFIMFGASWTAPAEDVCSRTSPTPLPAARVAVPPRQRSSAAPCSVPYPAAPSETFSSRERSRFR